MNDHITKPIERRALLHTLRRWLPLRQRPAENVDPGAARSESADSRDPAGAGVLAGRNLEGIDVAGSLKRLGLEFESFQRMLVRFADSQGATLDALRAAVASSDSDAVARQAHAIAGAAGNLGADALHAAAKALERAGRENSGNLAQLLTELDAQAAVVFRSIDTLRGAPATDRSEPTQVFVPADARALLERLRAALSDYDFSAASAVLGDLDGLAMPGNAADLVRLRNHVDSYEYDEAGVLATRLLAKIG